MNEVITYGKTLPEAYHGSLLLLQEAPITPCPDWNTNQKELSMTFVVDHPLQDNMISKLAFCDPASLEQYCQEMLDGILDFEIEEGKWKYTYHNRMVAYPVRIGNKTDFVNQLNFIIDELQRNPYSRRAVVDIRDNNEDMYSDDPACLQHMQFFIRDNQLHMKVLFRSNDACKAAFMNAFALIMLEKRIADTLGIEVGTYAHRANSYHCYERDFGMLDGYCKRIHNEDPDDLSYSYWDDWKFLMDDAKSEIANKVENLKNL